MAPKVKLPLSAPATAPASGPASAPTEGEPVLAQTRPPHQAPVHVHQEEGWAGLLTT